MDNNYKPIREWFDSMQEPERSQVFENTKADSAVWEMDNDEFLQVPVSSLNEALRGSFVFMRTPQGGSYWNEITKKY